MDIDKSELQFPLPSLIEIGSIISGKEAKKTRFQYCQNSCNALLYVRAIQGDTGGYSIEPELMGHVVIPFNWKQILFHRGCSFNLKSILEAGLIGGGKESREGRQTVFFTPLAPRREEIEEDFKHDLSKPRKVHHKTDGKRAQDAVYWIHLANTFWQTISHAIIACKTVPPDCIERMIFQKGETT